MAGNTLLKHVWACQRLTAKDGCTLRELLHPANDEIDLPYSLAVAELVPGESSRPHRLEQTEVYFVINGRGRAHIDEDEHIIGTGDALVIPGGAVQWVENIGQDDFRFAAIVSPPWTPEGDQSA